LTKVLLNLLGGDPDHLSGISVYAVRTMEALLRRRAHDYALVSSWPVARLKELLPLEGVEIVRGWVPHSEKLNYPVQAIQVWQAAARTGAEVVFTPWPFASPIGGRRRVLVLHDIYRRTHPELYPWHYLLAWNLFFPLSVATSRHVVTVSDATADEFRRLYPGAADKAVTVHEASTIVATPRVERPYPGRYGLTVSTTAPTKNILRLIEALERLRLAGGEQVPVLWIGKDHDDVVKTALARYPDLKSFIPLGRVDEETLATYYAHADFYVAASLTEGFCLPIVEAQKYGVPVVCSDIPVFREVAGAGASFFDPLDVASIATAIGEIGTDRGLHDRLSAAASANAARFSWDKAAAELEAMFAA
jgi:glycosyltransferase involved in cell wall biosynthesis